MPYTSHGHWVGDSEPSAADVQPRLVARCGGPGLCPECAREAIAAGHTGLEGVAAGRRPVQRQRYATRDELVELLAEDERAKDAGLDRAAIAAVLDLLEIRGVDPDVLVQITVEEEV